jgi:replicative DNA helicase
MSYVFDTSSIRSLQHFYPRVFKSIWDGLDDLVTRQELISTREVYNELERQAVSDEVLKWAKNHKVMFSTPTGAELLFVAEIFKIRHFQGLIVIACARIKQATVVTEEGWQRGGKALVLKPNAAKIPNVCAHFKIPCVDLEEFMHQQGWTF